jgi:hypothetical protein
MVACEFLIPYGLTMDPLPSFPCVSYLFSLALRTLLVFAFPSPTRNTDNTDSSLPPRYRGCQSISFVGSSRSRESITRCL